MLTDVIAAKWKDLEVTAWLAANDLAPVAVAVRHESEADGLMLFKVASYESNPLCLSVEKCFAMLSPEHSSAAVALPVLWSLILEYALDREHHDALCTAFRHELGFPRGTVWQLVADGFVTCVTGAVVKDVQTVKTKPVDDETLLVKIPFSAATHKTLFSLLRSLAFIEVQ